MRNLKIRSFLTLVLALALLWGLATSANAASAESPGTTVSIGGELEIKCSEDPYFYEIAGFLSADPVIMVDEENGFSYLSFELANISKLEYLFRNNELAFRLKKNLDLQDQYNDIQQAIWQVPAWRSDGVTIGSLLSDDTVRQIRSMHDANAYEIALYIRTCPEYKTIKRLQQDIDYYLSCVESNLSDLMKGMQLLCTPEEKFLQPNLIDSIHDLRAGEVVAVAHKLLEDHPEFACLDEVWRTYVSMPTSKFSTIQTLGQQKVDDLYTKVTVVAEKYWSGQLATLNRYHFVVPFSGGMIYQWPNNSVK